MTNVTWEMIEIKKLRMTSRTLSLVFGRLMVTLMEIWNTRARVN